VKTSTGAKLLVLAMVVGVVGALFFVLGVSAQVQPGTVNACVPSTGTRTMIYTTTGRCPTSQELITWSVQGPAGPQGPAGGAATPMKTALVQKSSKKDKKPTHSALVFCPAGWSLLYGGAGLVGDARSKTIVDSRPIAIHVPGGHAHATADPMAPSGWFARATRTDDYEHRLATIAQALTSMSLGLHHMGVSIGEDHFQHDMDASVAASGVGGLDLFFNGRDWAKRSITEDKVQTWAVKAWAVCGMTTG
jgi:hypothetical protein